MFKAYQLLFIKLYLFSDFLILNITYIFTHLIYKNFNNESYIKNDFYFQLWILVNIVWFFLFLFIDSYNFINNYKSFLYNTTKSYFLFIFLTSIFFFFKLFSFNFLFFYFFFFITYAICIILSRLIYPKLILYILFKFNLISKILIIGYNDTSKKLVNYLESEGLNIKIMGYADDYINITELSNYPIVSNLSNVVKVANELNIHEIFSTIMPEQNSRIYAIMNDAELNCLKFKLVPDFSNFLKKPILIDYVNDLPVLALRIDPLEMPSNQFLKRLTDILLSFFVFLFILSWLFPILSLLIKLESKGPIFFKQLRNGKNNIPFYCYKFRSMHINAESDSRAASQNDSRFTSVGQFIRKTSLDEFPQFLNVLKGDMSIVGPRPHMIKHTSDFAKSVDHYMVRQFLKPGITGWAQINNYRGEIQHPSQLYGRISRDLWYYENWSLYLDIKIIFLTFLQIFKSNKNAY